VVKVGIGEREIIMNAAVSDNLPRVTLLGWDMPELLSHIGGDSRKTTSADEQLAARVGVGIEHYSQQDKLVAEEGGKSVKDFVRDS
jgi:hypothetical protein